MSEPLVEALARAEARYRARHPESARCHARACEHLPGGSTRSAIHYPPFPLTWRGGQGNRLTDVDGLEYVDLLGEYSAGLYGHSEPRIAAAIARAVATGLVLGGPTETETRLAAALRERFPSLDLVRFTNSGTEANLMALSLVRAASPARRGVLVFEGAYHGGVLNFRHGRRALNLDLEFSLGTYDDVEGSRALLRSQAPLLGAVLVEPMLGGGCIPASPAFLRMLREECTALGLALIFDEVMTSRLSPGGMQGRLAIRPDLTTFGKYLGGGASFGAFGGRADLMGRFDAASPDALEHAGTFNNNPISMAAGLAGLTEVYTPEAAARLDALGDALRARLAAVAAEQSRVVRFTGTGSFIGVHLMCEGGEEARRALQALFHLEMLERGLYLGRRGYIALSLPTSAADGERFASAVNDFFSEHGSLIARGGHFSTNTADMAIDSVSKKAERK